jgi:hypothetical protein
VEEFPLPEKVLFMFRHAQWLQGGLLAEAASSQPTLCCQDALKEKS